MMNEKRSLVQPQRGVFSTLTAIVGLGLLVVLAFSLNILFASHSQQSSQTARQPQATVSQQPSLTPSIVSNHIDPAAEWQVYYFKNYPAENELISHLSVKYPPDWELRLLPREPGGKPILPEFRKEFSPHEIYTIYPTIHDNKAHLPLQEWVNRNVIGAVDIQDREFIKRQSISINGRKMEILSGAFFPAVVDSLHVYIDVGEEIVFELGLWPYKEEQFASRIDEEARSVLYNMATSINLSP